MPVSFLVLRICFGCCYSLLTFGMMLQRLHFHANVRVHNSVALRWLNISQTKPYAWLSLKIFPSNRQ